ncbi:carbohydrate sulfotransferase 12 isoform X1 [Siniperca chuatsi]|uniref:carbohydrate sulfotransferase 12 isoform X1 n=1 Tax=Siniperca chuatsi TaxID=119488 RepID=UPI001CE0B5BA|nr:carbohydrate sulfotransferase 12 isoform X1 [Siniperca chuatsi]XP_044047499.1 carbohydrate sulfotransferase 12 isoform X1 [Siniperca chuatsi]
MGTWRGLRVAFILGSLFMILLIIVYWDDVGGFNLYPLQDHKHESLHSDSYPPATTGPSTSASRAQTSSSFPTIASSTSLVPEETGGAPEEHTEEEGKDKQEQRKEETREDEEKERSRIAVNDSEQEARKKRLMDVCSGKDAVEFPGRTRAFDLIPNRELDHLIVDDTHQIIYCYVPKVACTNWKRVMVVLSQSLISPFSGKPYTDPEAVPPDLVHNSSLHLTFSKFWHHYGSLSRHLMALKLQHYTKFLFVRDPFVRLISAFRNKFGRPNEDFYRQFGSVMLRRYGNVSGSLPETAAEAFSAGIKPTFQQFITYLLDPETERESIFNEHWRQVYRLCHPCQVKYDFIGQLETLETDAEHLLKLLGVDHLLRFPSGARNRTATSWERDWFARIPISMRRELYRLYEPDFELFGYPKPDSVLH